MCRRPGISEPTFARWKAKLGGLAVSDAKRLRQLEAANSRLKRFLRRRIWTTRHSRTCAQNLVTPAARRRALDHLRAAYRCSARRACGLVGLARSVARYRSRRRDDAELRARRRELAGPHRRFGYLRLQARLRREARHGLPAEIVMDNGPEFSSRALFARSSPGPARGGASSGPASRSSTRSWRASAAGFGTSA